MNRTTQRNLEAPEQTIAPLPIVGKEAIVHNRNVQF